ncbi:unnamed protein product [Amaranthus hypochondriacus]
MEEITDLDMDAARQLVQLSEGESVSSTPTTSSSGSCNSIFFAFDSINGENTDDSKKKMMKRRKNHVINSGNFKDDDTNYTKEIVISSRYSTTPFGPVAGELEDDDDEVFDLNRRFKIRKYRSVVEMYSVTKPIEC